jgi:hypothetical protein
VIQIIHFVVEFIKMLMLLHRMWTVLILFHLVIHCILQVDDSKFANLAHQSVEFILGIISLQ